MPVRLMAGRLILSQKILVRPQDGHPVFDQMHRAQVVSVSIGAFCSL
jgi:hypothetical protein